MSKPRTRKVKTPGAESAGGKKPAGDVQLVDHNTGNTHSFDTVSEAEDAISEINKRNRNRGFEDNYSVFAGDVLVSRNGVAA